MPHIPGLLDHKHRHKGKLPVTIVTRSHNKTPLDKRYPIKTGGKGQVGHTYHHVITDHCQVVNGS